MKKLNVLFLLLPIILVMNVAVATQYDDSCPKKCYNECEDKPQSKPYEQGYEVCPNHLPQAYNAPAGINVCEGLNTYLDVSFIYWQILGHPGIIGFFYGVDSSSGKNHTQVLDAEYNYEYKPGFKVGLGQHFNHNNWDISLNYTRLESNLDYIFNQIGAWEFISRSTLYHPMHLANKGISSVTSKLDRLLNQLDLELSRQSYVGTHFIFKPFIGLSTFWLKQKTSIRLLSSAGDIKLDYNRSDKSWAIGPRIGISNQFLLGAGFKVFGNTAINLMYLSDDNWVDYDDDGIIINTAIDRTPQKFHSLCLATEAIIGLGWGSYFASNSKHFDFSVGYEVHRYTNTDSYNHVTTNHPHPKPQDTLMHGLTVNATFDF